MAFLRDLPTNGPLALEDGKARSTSFMPELYDRASARADALRHGLQERSLGRCPLGPMGALAREDTCAEAVFHKGSPVPRRTRSWRRSRHIDCRVPHV